jgi:mRNA turnover protein 4
VFVLIIIRPKSKRSKVVALTKTKKDFESLKKKKADRMEFLKQAIEEYNDIYAIKLENYQPKAYKKFLLDWRDSGKIFYCKRFITRKVFGVTKETELYKDISKIAVDLHGPCILLFTNESKKIVDEYFNNFGPSHYAKAGFIANVDFKIEKGKILILKM